MAAVWLRPFATTRSASRPGQQRSAKGLYVIRDFAPGRPRHGYVVAQGSSSTFNLVSVLPRLDAAGINAQKRPKRLARQRVLLDALG
jgi:hypothetical protein